MTPRRRGGPRRMVQWVLDEGNPEDAKVLAGLDRLRGSRPGWTDSEILEEVIVNALGPAMAKLRRARTVRAKPRRVRLRKRR